MPDSFPKVVLVDQPADQPDRVTLHLDGPATPEALASIMATLTTPPNEAARVLSAQLAQATDENLQLKDRALRMEAVLRLIRLKVMGEVIDPESKILFDWVKDWIDGFDNGVVTHGPIGGPLLWPTAAQGIVRQLLAWGFSPVVGPHNISYAALKRAPDTGEQVQ